MPLQKDRNLMTPDFYPDMQQQGWVDMGEDPQVNIQPAAGAFKQRFMGNKGGTSNVPNPMSEGLPEVMDGVDAGGGAPMKGLKSL